MVPISTIICSLHLCFSPSVISSVCGPHQLVGSWRSALSVQFSHQLATDGVGSSLVHHVPIGVTLSLPIQDSLWTCVADQPLFSQFHCTQFYFVPAFIGHLWHLLHFCCVFTSAVPLILSQTLCHSLIILISDSLSWTWTLVLSPSTLSLIQ